MRKICIWICVVVLMLPLLGMPAAAQQESALPYIQRMIQYYLHYQQDAKEEIRILLNYVSSLDPVQGQMWEKIMADWAYHNEKMTLNRGALPDGLPQDDSMCIVVLGFGLRSDGSMKEELVDRLVVALASALKYPNAYIAVTGGETSGISGISEAGQMADWLRQRGIGEDRLIVENRALSTAENAINVYNILTASYPSVGGIALISSDYHIAWGCTMFTTVSHYRESRGGKALKIWSNAANTTANTSDTLYSQAYGISSIMGLPFDGSTVPAKSQEQEILDPEIQAPTEPAVQEPEAKPSWWTVPLLAAGAAVLYLLYPKRPRKSKRRKRPEFKEE